MPARSTCDICGKPTAVQGVWNRCAEHHPCTSNAPHQSQATDLWRELCLTGKQLAEAKQQRDAALAERDRLRDAARAFLALLDRTNFSAVALRGPALDELRRLAE